MADTAITPVPAKDEITSAAQAQMPLLITGTYVANDDEYHAMVFSTRGKSRLTYGVDNPSNKDVVVTLYGSYSLTGAVDDAGVFLIPALLTVSATSSGYQVTDDGFLYYLIRCKSAAAGDSETVTVYAHLIPF